LTSANALIDRGLRVRNSISNETLLVTNRYCPTQART
jgi:hypothetical protein